MSIVTKGLGGASLITQGYGWLKWLVKVIKKIITRVIPRRRRKFRKTIKIFGDKAFPFRSKISVFGYPAFPLSLSSLF